MIGKEYSNNDIVDMFKVANLGSMRRSHSRNALVLISYHDGNDRIYNDYWKDDILFFSGRGQVEGKELKGQNKTLAESNENGVTVYLFELFHSTKYQYRGIAKLVSKPFTEKECGVDGIEREVWKFPLKLINSKDMVDLTMVDEQDAHLHQQVTENIGSALELFASASRMVLSGSERTVKTRRIQMNPVISEFVRMRASGKCEFCRCDAPFNYKGKPYLELGHIVPVSEGGKDSVYNIAALCPNCHARIDRLGLAQDKVVLRRNMRENEKKLSKRLRGEE